MGSISSQEIDTMFGALANASVTGSGNYFTEEGIHIVELRDFFVNSGFNGVSLIAEFTVLSSNNPEVKPGSSRSAVYKKDSQYFLANTKKIVMALLGYEPTRDNFSNPEIGKEIALACAAVLGSETARKEMGSAFSPDMFKGVKLRVECVAKQTKPSPKNPEGGTRIDCTWVPFTDLPASA